MSSSSSIETFEELGRGEHTVVFRGHDMTLNRQVAVKELTPHARSDARLLDQFVKEAQFLAQHQDENILSVYSVDRERGWIVMEFMQGNLASRVQQGPMDPDLVRSVLQQVLRALNFLHKKNKVHGKVRPSNILINDQGRVKLSDFEEVGAKAELRVPTGSKKYLAPELLKAEFGAFGPSLDLYCLGFTALELLKGPNFDMLFPGTGQGAIDADTAWMRWHTSDEEMRPVREVVPGVPDDLATVIEGMLKKHVKDRPQTAQKALDLLRDVPIKKLEVAPTAQTSGVPPVAAGVVGGGGGGSYQQPTAQPAARPAKPSKGPVNDFLGKPYVLYPLCAVMLIGAIGVGLLLRSGKGKGKGEAGPIAMNVSVEPVDANVTIDGKAIAPEKSGANKGKYVVEPGKHEFVFAADGYDEKKVAAEITATKADIGKVRLKKKEKKPTKVTPPKVVVDPPVKTTPDPDPVVIKPPKTKPPEEKSRLPEQLVAVKGAEIDPDVKLPTRIQVKLLADKAPLELVLFKPGNFTYGVEENRLPGELEKQKGSIDAPFYLALNETTNEQFEVFAKAQGESFESAWQKLWTADGAASGLPVRNVSWQAAQQFCQWAGGDLPSEKEWEYAARGSDDKGFPYPWQEETLDGSHANLFYGGAAINKPAPANDLAEGGSPAGLKHLLGNVAEWCHDNYSPGYGEDAQAKELAEKHVIRGCSFAKSSDDARVTWRAPEEDAGAPDVGVRLLVRIPNVTAP